MDQPLKVWLDRDGQLLRLRLARPKANIVDAEMIGALEAALRDHARNAGLAAVVLDHAGPHFSFGASVQEHLPGQAAEMLTAIHRLIRAMLSYPQPILVVASGQCLGGGLEVATAGSLIFAGSDAAFGQPEIKVGVFAPAASCILPARIGQARAEDLLLSGRSIGAEQAMDWGLVAEIAEDPEAAALAYFDQHLASHSATVLRHATQAAREDFAARVGVRLEAMEKIYLDGLMNTHDAIEGLQAFIDKRPAK
ncbi:MAG: cyclohexa-1,5-dienecarbonyl-CoA hydratase, partial [Rhodospirillales bacterium]|nr:cyclohexa-1,5-dienecarbonyl-CoA hydratase [Rhodospirillales bacterium]